MSELHSRIEHLKDQEKGYMDLLQSFSKFQNLASNLYTIDAHSDITKTSPNRSNNQYQKDILDLSELNESVHLQQQLQHNEIFKNHVFYLNDLNKNSATSLSALCQPEAATNAKSIAVQTSLQKSKIELIKNFVYNLNEKKIKPYLDSEEVQTTPRENSLSNSMAGSFISDTQTLNGMSSDMNNLLKYRNIMNNPNDSQLMVIGKGFNKPDNSEDENKV